MFRNITAQQQRQTNNEALHERWTARCRRTLGTHHPGSYIRIARRQLQQSLLDGLHVEHNLGNQLAQVPIPLVQIVHVLRVLLLLLFERLAVAPCCDLVFLL